MSVFKNWKILWKQIKDSLKANGSFREDQTVTKQDEAKQPDGLSKANAINSSRSRKLILEKKLPARIEMITPLTDDINAELEKLDCPLKAQNQIDVAIDEVFANIASYAYEGREGDATVRMEYDEASETVFLTFIDEGMPYDPSKTAEPDITLSAEERDVGGLGVFIVRKIMDDLKYRYEDNRNILEISKSLKG